MAMPIVIYGSVTCEDTALVRDHLQALGIPYTLRNREEDPEAERIIRRWNDDKIVTPTIVFGEGRGMQEDVISEPTLLRLEETLRAAGYRFDRRQAAEFRELANTPAPDFTLPASDGSQVRLSELRGRNKSAVFFAHDRACRICAGYARQLVRKKRAFEDFDTRLLLILQGNPEQAHEWSHEYVDGHLTLADERGEVKGRYADYFHQDAKGVLLLVLDRFTAPRAGSFAADAGGLIIPHEALEWLRLLDIECAE
ncbi:MAG: redoxin domain-containing protein [Rudaea sp.]